MPKKPRMKKWMLFVHEPSGDHYFWNGFEAVCVQNGSYDFSEPMHLDATERQSIADALDTSRKSLLMLHKVRYIIVAKGLLKEY